MDQVIILSGLSGSGKSTAVKCLEDIGFFCIDNLPPKLIYTFLDICETSYKKIKKVAIVLDTRVPDTEILSNFEGFYNNLKDRSSRVELIFLECSEEVIIQRYKETRRTHPMTTNGNIPKAITEEIKLLKNVKSYSDHIIDSSNYSIHKLKEILQDIVGIDRNKIIKLSFVSFGYKYGFPYDADIVFDVRFLKSPHFIESLKDLNGNDKEIVNFIMSESDSQTFIKKSADMLEFLIPRYIKEGKPYLTVAIGCTGGKHRSIVISNKLYEIFKKYSPDIRHRDINRL